MSIRGRKAKGGRIVRVRIADSDYEKLVLIGDSDAQLGVLRIVDEAIKNGRHNMTLKVSVSLVPRTGQVRSIAPVNVIDDEESDNVIP